MPDHHHIVDQIRALTQATDQSRSAGLDGWAAAYAQACAEVNERLLRCQRLLQQGLRSEAIQLAEIEPRLLDSVAVLDFPERRAWDELAGGLGLPVAARLHVEAAAFLNEAYAQEDPLQDLLRSHRRLALMRAPLKARIGVLRARAGREQPDLDRGPGRPGKGTVPADPVRVRRCRPAARRRRHHSPARRASGPELERVSSPGSAARDQEGRYPASLGANPGSPQGARRPVERCVCLLRPGSRSDRSGPLAGRAVCLGACTRGFCPRPG